MSELRIAAELPDGASARALMHRYFDELADRFPGGPGEFDGARIAAPASEFGPPDGVFLVARLDGRDVGCGAVRRLDDRTAEIKRMWVDPTARGAGIGRRVLAALEEAAAGLGPASCGSTPRRT